jgi:hypothetical protein
MAAQEVLNRVGSRGEVTLILGDGREQLQELPGVAPRGGMLVAPQGPEQTGLLLAANPVDELARMIAHHVPASFPS